MYRLPGEGIGVGVDAAYVRSALMQLETKAVGAIDEIRLDVRRLEGRLASGGAPAPPLRAARAVTRTVSEAHEYMTMVQELSEEARAVPSVLHVCSSDTAR